MSEIKKVKLPNDSTIYDIDATTVNGHTVDIDVPDILKDLPTGSISTVNDAAPLPLNALKVSVEAWQEGSGDPSPSNIRPIHGWSSGEIGGVGKNLLQVTANTTTINGITFTVTDDKTIKTNGTTTGAVLLLSTISLKKGQYILSSGVQTSSFRTYFLRVTDSLQGDTRTYQQFDYEGGGVVAIDKDMTLYVTLHIQNGQTVSDLIFYPMIRILTDTSTTFEPYQGNTITQQFPQTIYGAEWDVVGGEGLKITDGFAEYDGSEAWEQDAINYYSLKVYLPTSWISNAFGQSNEYKYNGTTSGHSGMDQEGMYWWYNSLLPNPNYRYLMIRDDNQNSLADFKQFLSQNPLQVLYKLATPTTIQLSSLSIRMLQGVNNLYADCGEVIEGEYFVDSELTDGIVSVAEKINTDTNDKVTQTSTSTDSDYEVLFSGTADDTTRTEGVRKNSSFIYNPQKQSLVVGTLKANTRLGTHATAFGFNVTASGICSHAEGSDTVASDAASHAEGDSTTASNTGSHAEGRKTVASGMYSHTEGFNTTASGNYSHAEGSNTIASGMYSHTEGLNTTANHKSQHVFGEYNVLDESTAATNARGNYVEIVGNGTDNNARSNARTLDWSGNEWIAGTLTQGSSKKIKKNISPITDDEISKVLELNGVKFDYVKTGTDNQAERGFIAEEVAKVLPNLVTEEWTDDNGNLLKPASLNYLAIIPYLVEICKKQQEEIDELKQKIKE